MISVTEAEKIINSVKRDYGTESVPLTVAVGRVLRENLYADRPFPPFHRVTMDGIALRYAAFAGGQRSFKVEATAAAGAPQMTLKNAENCMEVMTGAVLPEGTDTVIRYEDLEISNGIARLLIHDLKEGKNVHRKGSDRAAGELLVAAGGIISPAEIGVAATVGKAEIQVSQTPKTLIISTGDELVEVSEKPLPHQIRRSNVYLLQSIFEKMKAPAEVLHLADDYDLILEKMRDILTSYDVLVLSGGVSMGKFDFLPKAFKTLGVKEHFYKVKQRPGKPLWFGESQNGTVIFALPGNPVSSFSCAQKFVYPWLKTALGLPPEKITYAVLTEDFTFKPALTYFLQVKTSFDKSGRLLAAPTVGNGSGDLANLPDADGFLELPADHENFAAGSVFPFQSYR